MAPNTKEHGVINHGVGEYQLEKLVAPQADSHKFQIIYYVLVLFIYMHIAGFYGITYIPSAKWSTLIFMYIYHVYGFLGLTAGVHRLWSHKCFKATLPLQILLMLAHSTLNQFTIVWWTKTHRLHHKYSDTDADPSNATRGFFFSHFGWFMVKLHPKGIERKRFMDFSDLENDPVLSFQRKFVFPIIGFMSIILPTTLPMLWGESFATGHYLNMLRLTISYNTLFTVNSIAHRWGSKPYDKYEKGIESGIVSFLVFGEGYHNYHHTFPWDYKGGEWSGKWNFTTLLLDALAKIGWAYDLKTVPTDVVNIRASRNGDGSLHSYRNKYSLGASRDAHARA